MCMKSTINEQNFTGIDQQGNGVRVLTGSGIFHFFRKYLLWYPRSYRMNMYRGIFLWCLDGIQIHLHFPSRFGGLVHSKKQRQLFLDKSVESWGSGSEVQSQGTNHIN
jgi:hypothetical protein